VAKASPESVNFDIHERNGMRLVGDCGIFDIDRVAGTAECGILIGEKDCWNRGYGTETMVLLAQYAFDTLGLCNLMLHVYDFNTRAIAAYRRAGFHEAGRRRHIRHGGQLVDEIIMDILPGAGFHEAGRRRRIRHGRQLVDEIIMDILPGEVAILP